MTVPFLYNTIFFEYILDTFLRGGGGFELVISDHSTLPYQYQQLTMQWQIVIQISSRPSRDDSVSGVIHMCYLNLPAPRFESQLSLFFSQHVKTNGKLGFSTARFSVPGFPFMIFHSTLLLLNLFPLYVFPF